MIYQVHPHSLRVTSPVDGGQVGIGSSSAIGTLAELKAHTNVEHDEDDEYLGRLLATAQREIGGYTRWPMVTSALITEARWPVPRVSGSYTGTRLHLPGPVNIRATVRLRQYQDGRLVDGPTLSMPRRSDRVPHDAIVDISDAELSDYDDGGFGELIVQYTRSWSSIYTGTPAWPPEVAHGIYRVAATLYLYRESTVMGDRPSHQTMRALFGPYLPVVL